MNKHVKKYPQIVHSMHETIILYLSSLTFR